MTKTLIVLALLALIGGGVALAASSGSDALPKDPNRADCPGQITCPLTGALICADRCPLEAEGEDGATGDVPSCCQGK